MIKINPIQAVLMMGGALIGVALDGLILVLIGIIAGFVIGIFIK